MHLHDLHLSETHWGAEYRDDPDSARRPSAACTTVQEAALAQGATERSTVTGERTNTMADEWGPEVASHSFSDLLEFLFEHFRPRGEDRKYSNREVVTGLRAAGNDMSESHFSQLRRGITKNPTLQVLQGIAAFFDVRVAYLLGDPDAVKEVQSKAALRTAMQDAHVQDVAHRVAGLNARQRVAFNELLADIIQSHSDEGASRGES